MREDNKTEQKERENQTKSNQIDVLHLIDENECGKSRSHTENVKEAFVKLKFNCLMSQSELLYGANE
jgi:hypothetical protein